MWVIDGSSQATSMGLGGVSGFLGTSQDPAVGVPRAHRGVGWLHRVSFWGRRKSSLCSSDFSVLCCFMQGVYLRTVSVYYTCVSSLTALPSPG